MDKFPIDKEWLIWSKKSANALWMTIKEYSHSESVMIAIRLWSNKWLKLEEVTIILLLIQTWVSLNLKLSMLYQKHQNQLFLDAPLISEFHFLPNRKMTNLWWTHRRICTKTNFIGTNLPDSSLSWDKRTSIISQHAHSNANSIQRLKNHSLTNLTNRDLLSSRQLKEALIIFSKWLARIRSMT